MNERGTLPLPGCFQDAGRYSSTLKRFSNRRPVLSHRVEGKALLPDVNMHSPSSAYASTGGWMLQCTRPAGDKSSKGLES